MTPGTPPAPSSGEPVRLAKRVAAMVPCSRSEAERYIEGGWIRVDGAVVEVPQARVSPEQTVTLDSAASLLALMPLTVLANVASSDGPGALSLAGRWPEDHSGLHVTATQLRQVRELLPLPAGAEGLAVYSQDPRIIRKLTEDGLAIEQEWVVQVQGQLPEGGLARLERLAEPRTALPLGRPPLKASWQSEQRLRLAFKGIDPAQIPALCGHVGLVALQGRRLRLGRLPLSGLPAGQWRALAPHERF